MKHDEAIIDETLAASFPASDAPGWTLGRRERASDPEAGWSSLLREHQNIRALLGFLKVELGALLGAGSPRYDLMTDALRYLTSYVDVYHHGREDAAFELAVLRDPRLEGVVSEAARQHAAIIDAGSRLRADLERAAMDAPVLKSRISSDGKAYVDGLREHLRYEEVEVFPRLGAALDAEDWRVVDARAGRVVDPLFGPVTEERYWALFERITALAGCGCALA